eukprot:g20496.t1
MGFQGQTVVNAVILACAASLTATGFLYVAMMWSLRHNFFMVLRSPLLACTFGFCITLRYFATLSEDVLVWDEDEGTVRDNGFLDLIGFPALVAAFLALVMTAARLLVMYYPSKRAKWGRYTKEKFLMWALGFVLVLMEIVVWYAAWTLGVMRTADTIEAIRVLFLIAVMFAAVCLGFLLRNVHDSTNLSRDIGLTGRLLFGILCLYLPVQLLPMSQLTYKYVHIVYVTIVHPPVVYVVVIRPVREILSAVPAHRRNCTEAVMAPRHRRSSSNTIDDADQSAVAQGRAVSRLATIMNLPPLRAAFGGFCQKSLCSESFEFLVRVADFKASVPVLGAGHDEVTHDFARYLLIVNSFIRYDSHLEINIGSDIKRDVMEYIKFEAFLMLEPGRRREIFNRAEEEISKLLTLNLLGKFLASVEYKAAVDLESG